MSPRSRQARGEGHGEIGLAGAGRSGGEDEVVLLERREIGALRRRARRDQALARADLAGRSGDFGARCAPGIAGPGS